MIYYYRKMVKLMQSNYQTFNDILVNLFNEIMDIESDAIITDEFRDITNNDMHIIEAVGIDEPKNMSAIAKRLSVAMGALTISMNSLVRKGYVVRKRSEEDRRVVYICLTEKGEQAYHHHAAFHHEMVEAVIKELDNEEKEILNRTLVQLKKFFKEYKGVNEGKSKRSINDRPE